MSSENSIPTAPSQPPSSINNNNNLSFKTSNEPSDISLLSNIRGTVLPVWAAELKSKQTVQWIGTKQQNNSKITNPIINSLKFLTYNIWFTPHYQPTRVNALINIIENSNADFFCLQEVTQKILKFIVGHSFIGENYYISDCDGNTFKTNGYGVVMFVKKSTIKLNRFTQYEFPSKMGRNLLLADCTVNVGENQVHNIFVGTVHLESLNNEPRRKQQLKICSHIFNSLSNHPSINSNNNANQLDAKTNTSDNNTDNNTCLLMGDFNFDDKTNWGSNPSKVIENDNIANILPDWLDAWPILHPNTTNDSTDQKTNSCTFDGKNNEMISDTSTQTRIDRIMFRSEQFQLEEMQIKGNTKIGEGEKPSQLNPSITEKVTLFPSDHYGLELKIKLKN